MTVDSQVLAFRSRYKDYYDNLGSDHYTILKLPTKFDIENISLQLHKNQRNNWKILETLILLDTSISIDENDPDQMFHFLTPTEDIFNKTRLVKRLGTGQRMNNVPYWNCDCGTSA